MTNLSTAPLIYNDHPDDQDFEHWWREAKWQETGDGSWVPTAIDKAVGRVVVQKAGVEWVAVLDGTVVNEKQPVTPFPQAFWNTRESAGYDALRMVEYRWHGPALRFRPSEPWAERHGFWMRPLIFSGAARVAVIRQWPPPSKGSFGIFLTSNEPYALEVFYRPSSHFPTAEAAMRAADTEVGRWGGIKLPAGAW